MLSLSRMLFLLLLFVLSVQSIQFTFQQAEQRPIYDERRRLEDPYSPGNWIEYIPVDRPPLPKPDPHKPPRRYRKTKNITLDFDDISLPHKSHGFIEISNSAVYHNLSMTNATLASPKQILSHNASTLPHPHEQTCSSSEPNALLSRNFLNFTYVDSFDKKHPTRPTYLGPSSTIISLNSTTSHSASGPLLFNLNALSYAPLGLTPPINWTHLSHSHHVAFYIAMGLQDAHGNVENKGFIVNTFTEGAHDSVRRDFGEIFRGGEGDRWEGFGTGVNWLEFWAESGMYYVDEDGVVVDGRVGWAWCADDLEIELLWV